MSLKNLHLGKWPSYLRYLLLMLAGGVVHYQADAQIAIPYNENFSSIAAANAFPTVAGGAWTRTGTTTTMPTYIASPAAPVYNRVGRGDSRFMSFQYGQPSSGGVFAVGPFNLTAGNVYQVGTWYIADGLNGFGPMSLTYGTGTTALLQNNTIVSIPANITNTTYQQLSGTFSPATSGSYYIGIKVIANSTPWWLTVDDFSVSMLPLCGGTPVASTATSVTPMSVSGFTADVIANGVGAASSSTTADVDGGGYYFLDSSYQFTASGPVPTYALPVSGAINSASTPGLSFKLAAASGNNALRLATTNASGTLTLSTPVASPNLYLLATSGGAAATMDVTVNFSNATAQTFPGLIVSDWYNGAGYAAAGIGRVTATNTQDGTATNPRLYEFSLPINPANSALTISSVTVTRTSAAGILNIMGISAATTMPATICTGNSVVLNGTNTNSLSGITYQWQQSSVSGGPYTDVTTGTGGTTLTYASPALSATTYYVLKTLCANSSQSILSNQVTVPVSALPSLSVATTPASGIICGTGSVSLTASGNGTAYLWTPASGLSAANTATTVASPTVTTNYTVTATNAAGCSSRASKTIILSLPTTISGVATPAAVCIGGNLTLQAVDSNKGNATMLATYTNGSVVNPTIDEDFGTITLGGFTNTTACNTLTGTIGTATGVAGSYANFSGLATPSYVVGATYPLSLSSITCGASNYQNAIGMYIDYNQNGSFADAGETVYLSSGTTLGAHTETGTVLIPATAKPGVTRMRIIVNESSVPSGAQISPSYGEIEDYAIRIVKTGTIAASNFSWSPATALSSTTGSPVNVTNLMSNTVYTITGTDSFGCTATGTVTASIIPPPTVTISPATATAICAGDSATLTASGAATYSWSPATGLSATTGAIVKASPSATTTYTITGTSASGCVNTITKTVTVNQLPTLSILPAGATAVCPGGSVALTVSGASTYSWSPAATLSAATGTPVTAMPTATIDYTVTGTDANGCRKSAVKTVTVNTPPTIAISPATASAVCAGSSIALTASGAVTYSWTPAATLSAATGASVTATPTGVTTYTVSGTDANGCINTASKTITINALPTISFSPSTATSICSGGNVALTASGAVSYSWSPAASLSASTGATVTASPATQTTYTVMGTDANGCVGSGTKMVAVNALPTITISPATTNILCIGSSIALTASGASTYSWTPASTLNAATGSSVTASPTVTTTYSITGTDALGCSNTVTKTLTVFTPTISLSPATPVAFCVGGSVVLTATGGSTYVWSPATGLSSTTGASVTATPAATTTYTVTGTDGNGCNISTSKLITVYPVPPVAIAPSTATTICSGNSVVLTASGASTYSWTPSGSLSASTGATVSAFPTATTTYTVTGTSVNGCTRTATKLVTVNTTPTVTISSTTPTTFCIGNSVALTAGGAATYSWTPAATLSAATGATVTATPATTTTYTVTGIAANGCQATAAKLVTVNPLPVLNVTPATATTICAGSNVALSVSGASTYTWSPATGLSATSGSTVLASPGATVTYTITGTNTNGCVNTATKTVNVLAVPTVSVTPAASTVCNGVGVVLSASGADSYSWSPAVSFNSATGASVTATPSSQTTYTVTGTAANGCTGTATALINVNALPRVVIAPFGLNLSCQGTTVTLSASGAATYEWSPSTGLSSTTGASVGANPATSTVYSVTGTDSNGCVSVTNGAVVRFPKPQAEITPAGVKGLCIGDSTRLRAIYTRHPSYSWQLNGQDITGATSNSFLPSVDGAYSVRVTDTNGCTKVSDVPAVLNFTPAPMPVIAYNGNVLSTTAAFQTYQWYMNGQLISGATSRDYVPKSIAFYTVTVSKNNGLGCTGTSAAFAISKVGINQTVLGEQLKIYPNPTSGLIHVSAIHKVQLILQDLTGKVLLKGDSDAPLDIATLADGLYLLNVIDGSGRLIRTEKITKNAH